MTLGSSWGWLLDLDLAWRNVHVIGDSSAHLGWATLATYPAPRALFYSGLYSYVHIYTYIYIQTYIPRKVLLINALPQCNDDAAPGDFSWFWTTALCNMRDWAVVMARIEGGNAI